MGLIVKDIGGGDWALCPEGTHIARCNWVIDLGTHLDAKYGKPKRQVLLGFELPNTLLPDGDRAGEPFLVTRRFTQSLGPKAHLRAFLQAWRGRTFTDEELEGFDLFNVAGKPCFVTITHNKSQDGSRTYTNIVGVAQLPKGTACPDPINPTRTYSIEQGHEGLSELAEWLQKIIQESDEFRGDGTAAPMNDAPGEEMGDDSVPF